MRKANLDNGMCAEPGRSGRRTLLIICALSLAGVSAGALVAASAAAGSGRKGVSIPDGPNEKYKTLQASDSVYSLVGGLPMAPLRALSFYSISQP